jgi:WD40 repeat protein
MKGLFGLAAATAATLLIALGVSAAGVTTPAKALKQVGLPVNTLAMDGSRVLYSSDDDAVRVWDVRTGKIILLRRGAGRFTDNPTIRELAIAGQRTAWITLASAGNSQETWARLFTASLPSPIARKIASAFRVDGYGEGSIELWKGDWVSGLVGAGNLLVVSRWSTAPSADSSGLTISNARLSLVEPGSHPLRVVVSGTRSIVSAAVDAGRIAVLRPDEGIAIYSSNGNLVREIRPSSAQELAFGGGRVVVLTETRTIEVYDAGTGARLRTWPVSPKTGNAEAGHLSAYGRIGVYLVDARHLASRLHVVDLSTGKEVVLPVSQHSGRDAVVSRLGLVYAVNKYYFGVRPPKRTGTLVFLSTKQVLAGIGRGRLP